MVWNDLPPVAFSFILLPFERCSTTKGENLCSIARISMGMVSPLPLLTCLDGSTPLVSPASRGPLHYHAAVKLKEGEGGIESMPERTDTDGWMADRTRGEKLLMDLREGIPEDSDLFTSLRLSSVKSVACRKSRVGRARTRG